MAMWRGLLPDNLNPDDVRMTLGEHLEELRNRLIKAMLALLVTALLCWFVFIDQIMGLLAAPLMAALDVNDQVQSLHTMSPAESFVTELKVAFIVGFILAAPVVLAQIWGFVGAGLYPHERKWVTRFLPVSVALFFVGASFLLFVVSPFLLNFLVVYRTEYPDYHKYFQWVLSRKEQQEIPTTRPEQNWPAALATQPAIPALMDDPVDAPEGRPWINRSEHQVRVRYGDRIYRIAQLEDLGAGARVTPMIRMSDYVIFVLELAAAFGIGFQVPVVVAFVGAIGLASASAMGKVRRYVWFGMAIVAAIVTPPDVVSMLMLLVPMVALYEVGLLAARFFERERRGTPHG